MTGNYRRIDVTAARSLMADKIVRIVDVRDEASYARCRIPGAERTEQSALASAFGETPRDTPVLIYCYKGNASRLFAASLAAAGFTEVYSLDGGFEAWERSGFAEGPSA